MPYAHRSTTTNTAEYWGVVHGLRGAQAHQFAPLTVIEDSELIIKQQRKHRPSMNAKLRTLHYKVRRIADSLGVSTWVHRYRAYIKMADKAANIIMGSHLSQQALSTSGRSLISELSEHLDSDVGHWLTDSSPDARLAGRQPSPVLGAPRSQTICDFLDSAAA